MAGDDDKKKKVKKVKKVDKPAEEAAAPPAPETEPAPAPEPEPAAPAQGDDWLSEATAEKTEEAAPEAPPAEGQEDVAAQGLEGEVMAEAPPAPKKKPKFFIHWNRRKPKFYDYNFDYGTNYYSSVINYLDNKNLGATEIIPRRKAFAERGIDSSVIRKSHPDILTQNIMHNVRSSIRGYENFARDYTFDVDRKYFE